MDACMCEYFAWRTASSDISTFWNEQKQGRPRDVKIKWEKGRPRMICSFDEDCSGEKKQSVQPAPFRRQRLPTYVRVPSIAGSRTLISCILGPAFDNDDTTLFVYRYCNFVPVLPL